MNPVKNDTNQIHVNVILIYINDYNYICYICLLYYKIILKDDRNFLHTNVLFCLGCGPNSFIGCWRTVLPLSTFYNHQLCPPPTLSLSGPLSLSTYYRPTLCSNAKVKAMVRVMPPRIEKPFFITNLHTMPSKILKINFLSQ